MLQFAWDCVVDCILGHADGPMVGLDLCVLGLILMKLCVALCMGFVLWIASWAMQMPMGGIDSFSS